VVFVVYTKLGGHKCLPKVIRAIIRFTIRGTAMRTLIQIINNQTI